MHVKTTVITVGVLLFYNTYMFCIIFLQSACVFFIGQESVMYSVGFMKSHSLKDNVTITRYNVRNIIKKAFCLLG